MSTPTDPVQPTPLTRPAPSTSAQPSPLTNHPDAITAAQGALAAEHAAVWCYTLITAFLSATLDQRARDDVTAHRARRAALELLLTNSGTRPLSAQPAYRTPTPVTDQASAVQLAALAESDAAAAWRAMVERTTDAGLRTAALAAMTDSTVRGAHWRAAAGLAPAVPDFPGRQ